jgi:peptidoglycan pentaglycine glycine transferase (the first glycine)
MAGIEHITDGVAWNNLIGGLPQAHLLQTWQWGQVKSRFGWTPSCLAWRSAQGAVRAAALVLERSQRLPGTGLAMRVLYVPKGPLLDWGDAGLRRQVLADLADEVRRRGGVFIKLDADVRLGYGVPGEPGASEDATGAAVAADLKSHGWRLSQEQIQFRNTVVINLQAEPEQLLNSMKQKTRYNIRLAERKGVCIRSANLNDLPLLFRMYAETSQRDGFVIRDEAYYYDLWSTFMNSGLAEPIIAEFEGEPLAAVVIYYFAGQAWYLNGMSRLLHREYMPNYLLQWEAMRRARDRGCSRYDLWGAPDEFNETDSMWGVFRFKEGLGGQVERGLGAWDLPVQPLFYRLYTQLLPRILDIMRRRGKERTRQLVG